MDNMYVQDPILAVILNRLDTIDTRIQMIEDALIRMARIKEAQKGDEFLDNQDLCTLLKISKRTLRRYREKGLIQYYVIDGKTFYKASEVDECMKQVCRERKTPAESTKA